ncbi:hypothetical protein TPEGhana051_0645 [Treponema pallidum subsp. pertenue]|uniref:Uncharacterized protein n=2 Tax=Treponema pallidum TaxID=160 RepID=A0AAU8RQE6_TREPL|nr:hypothetical protein TPESAMD_0645 [Treponema pallidum subsp. pertenue str. SamoaD]AEZ58839.1 hypothetical protein TPECDC2_0645 [Treponema pallidum subsp. pertenue str. CDC2]AEZ59907.1 hypothetical protein TPEGAU_0645 [Treponema pallidum subsp. pertenue str. Gauthier]AGK84291.1 hypothetical protein TPFB_0645 [Treponema pallidum str. Fribourg-Blanc]AJB40667.1 hypothetical protein TENDBA_0645 [Treponema pallidum subsp. endemicum str. Bosnia A]ASV58297.1 hypothetical protein TPEGhana051_0645 [T
MRAVLTRTQFLFSLYRGSDHTVCQADASTHRMAVVCMRHCHLCGSVGCARGKCVLAWL